MPGHIPRRRVLQVAGGGIVVGAGAVGAWQWLSPEAKKKATQDGAPVRPAKATTSESFVHVIAHPDDSLYFMNPELEQSILGGGPSVTVCLTGGESDGRNELSGARGYKRLPEKRGEFVRARLNGFREATAQMATGDWLSPWTVEALSLLPGIQVELHTLRAAPQVQLIFLELVEARTLRNPRKESLRGLWLEATPQLTTLRPAGSPVRSTFQYGRKQLIDTLVAIFERYQPTVVRTLDPNPTHLPKPPEFPNTPPVLRGIAKYDHQDHTTSAFFAQAALAEYWGRKHARPTAVDSYVGYEVTHLPSNLDKVTTDHKLKFLDTYGWADGKDCGDTAGCGDRKVGRTSGTKYHGWSSNCRHRAPGTMRWVQPLSDGRLAAFAVLDGAAQCWTEAKAGSGIWSTPTSLGGSMLEGQVQALRHSDGTLQLFSIRTVLPAKDTPHRREVVTALQSGGDSGGTPSFGPWESLGSPEQDPARSMEMGYPVAVAGTDGTVHVFVRTFEGEVSRRSGAGGKDFSEWETLPSADPRVKIEDGLDAALDSQGRIHLVAADTKTVHHWMSQGPGGPLQPAEPTKLPAVTGPLSLAPLPSGGMRMAVRQPNTSRVLVVDRIGDDKGWRVSAQCDPLSGHGRVAVGQAGNTTVLTDHDGKGRVRLSAGSGRPGPWGKDGIPFRGVPGVALDAKGNAVAVVVMGLDNKLSSARLRGSGKGAFTDWIAHDGKARTNVQS
ncbi:PIG-L family deacetylase [Streptomyces roseifaciens]|uniref:PIG-L family deacetylase n=1 Tax=Streptomyces roseifaciens TaxID=1488406 RepID=UPI00071815A8|nr:PIG-L family deacetylase [Streptomyces roseifaciens]